MEFKQIMERKDNIPVPGEGKRNTILVSVLDFFVLIPLTGYLSYRLGDKNLYIASVIIMILAMVPFFVSFEGSRPDARQMSTLAVMTAITVVSRVAFIMFPNFKPMGGMVVITAYAFGPQAGFMTGALAMIVSNILFGQGPWTPWQMFCYGMIGLIGGLLAKRRIISEKHAIRSAVITFLLVTVLSSLILDTCSVFLMGQYEMGNTAAAIYLAGLPYDISNGIASGLCVFFLIKPMAVIFRRIRKKYGIYLS